MMKKLIAILLIISFAFTLFSCDNSKEPGNNDDEYVLPTEIVDSDVSLPYTSADSFSAYSVKSSLNRDLLPIIYESLYVATQNGKGRPLLAKESVTKGKTITVTLKTDVSFSDGSFLMADDVKASYNMAKKNEYYKDGLANIKDVKASGNKVIFTLYRDDPMALNVLDFPICKKSGNDYVGTGKYSVAYLDETPYLRVNTAHRDFEKSWNKQVALYDMAGITSPVYSFKANDISIYKNDLSSADYVNLSPITFSENTNNLVFIGLNSKWQGSVAYVNWVRQVINIGINRRDIASSSFLGQNTPVVTPFKTEFYGLDDSDLADISGETEKAINILERNGYSKFNSEGLRTNGSRTLKVNILVCSKNAYKVSVAEAVKKSLESLGFKVTIIKKKTVKDFKAALQEGHFSMYIGEMQLTDNCDLSEFFSASGSARYGIKSDFYSEYSDYKKGELSTTEFVEVFSTQVPFIPLFYRKSVISVNPNVKGVDENDIYGSVCYWRMPEKTK